MLFNSDELEGFRVGEDSALDYLHGRCHDFAYGLSLAYGYNIVIVVDYDLDIEEMCLVHAFCVGPVRDRFIDALGIHHSLEGVLDSFDYGTPTYIECRSIQDFLTHLSDLRVPLDISEELVTFISDHPTHYCTLY